MRVAVAIVLFLCLRQSVCIASTHLEVDPAVRGIRIEVDEDAPPVIELKSEDLLPIRWERNGLRKAVLPAVLVRDSKDLVIVDDAAVSHALTYDGYLNRVRIMPDFNAIVGTWHGQPSAGERGRIVWAAILFSLGLLLVLLIRRRAFAFAALYCVIWMIAILIHQSRRPQVAVPSDMESRVFVPHLARSDQTLRVAIAARIRWIPVVESLGHLRSLNPRVEVDGDRPSIVIDLKQNAIVGLMGDERK